MEEQAKEKKTIMIGLPRLKGKDKYETAENFSILFIFIGCITLAAGMVVAGFNPVGLGAVMTMMGTLVAFLATIALIFTWLIKEFHSD